MDVVGVEAVINYEPPPKFKTYLHRVGRTARAGQRGAAYSLLDREEVQPLCVAMYGRAHGAPAAPQVPAFTAMMRTAGRRQVTQLEVPSDECEPFRVQYEHALNALREDIMRYRST